jgi:hypothetical protein
MFKEVSKGDLGEQVKFENIGEFFTGTLKDIKVVDTKYGSGTALNFTDENGELKTIFASSALKLYDWPSMVGKLVRIEYIADVDNPKSGQTYKDFKVLVDED